MRADVLAGLEKDLDTQLLAELRAVGVVPGRPLLAVDSDEVMVDLGGHLARFAEGLGIAMKLERYQLEGAFSERVSGRVLSFQESIGIIDRFFQDEVRRQKPLPGAAEALDRLSARAQVVVLTNVPRHGRDGRVENLASLGMGYPLICNSGGKGRALAWLRAAAGAPTAFVDDSPGQIASAKRRAPDVLRVHFAGAEAVARVIPHAPEADHRAASWAEAVEILEAHLGR